MKYGNHFSRGDLVCWEEWEGIPASGIILDIYPSNVYEPEECEIFSSGVFRTIKSKCLKLVEPVNEKEK